MRSGRIAIAVGLLLLLALLIGRGAPFLTQKREVTASVPTPNAVGAVSAIMLKPGSQVCSTLISYSHDAQVARFVAVGDPKQPGPALTINADGPGYHKQAEVPGGYPGTGPVEVALDPPAHSLIGQFCIRNTGTTQAV